MSNEKETKVSALDAKAKALANEEDEDTKIAKLLKNMPKWRFYSLAVLTVIWTVFQLYIKLVKPLDPWFQLPLHMCLALVVVWLYNPMVEKSKSHNKLWWIYDIFLIASSCFICWFFLSHAEQLNYRIFNVDVMTTTEVIVAVLLVINVMEAVRRVVSMSLFWVICFFLAYAWFGQYIPGLFRFSGISFPKLMEVLMYGENGIFGSPLVTSLGTLFYFLVFGTFFSNCGGGGVLIDGGMKLSDKTVGGPAKAAVISSGLLGMVSGSAIANVSTTGVLTIPLMKKTGYDPEEAAAVESVASTGGQIMPPIMGAAAFILAEMTGIGYGTVCVAAAIPAFLYYISVFIMVDVEALKNELLGMDEKDIPLLIPVLKRSAKLIIPVVVLIVTLVVFNITPMRCALYAMAAVVLCALFDKNDRFSFKHLKNAFCQAAIGSAQIVAACAASGIVIAMLSLTGLGLKFSNFILTLGGSNLVLCLVFSMLVSIILGMGLPTTAAYIITATTIAPSLLKLGLPPLCAHLFLFYFASLSCITPPVAIASYAGAALADANPSKVGWEAVRLGIVAFLIPYSFCLTPGVIMLDFSSFATGVTGVLSALLTLLAALPIAWLMQGYTYRRVGILWRLLFAVCAVMLIIPDLIIEIPAAVIVLGIYYLHKRDYVKGRSIPA